MFFFSFSFSAKTEKSASADGSVRMNGAIPYVESFGRLTRILIDSVSYVSFSVGDKDGVD